MLGCQREYPDVRRFVRVVFDQKLNDSGHPDKTPPLPLESGLLSSTNGLAKHILRIMPLVWSTG